VVREFTRTLRVAPLRAAVLALLVASAGAAAATAAPGPASASSPTLERTLPAGMPAGLIVRMRSTVSRASRRPLLRRLGAETVRDLGIGGLLLVRPTTSTTAAELEARLEGAPGVASVEPDRRRTLAGVPNDPWFSQQWALQNSGQEIGLFTTGTPGADIRAPQAWDLTMGSPGVLVAVVDSGAALDHPDLAPALWTNPGETGADAEGRDRRSNGIDDDRNGFVDDWRGWDFVDGDNAPADESTFPHGTAVSGVIAARGSDGFGVSGVAPRVSLLELRASRRDGSLRTSDVLGAFAYAIRAGAKVVNASFGGPVFSQAERDVIASAPGTLFVVSAGNDGRDNDTTPTYPCNYGLPNIVCVGATDQRDALTDFSNRGASVDVAAPGYGVLTDAPAFDTLFADDFEQPLGGRWSTGGAGATWGETTARHVSGQRSLSDSPGGAYQANSNSFITTASAFSLAGRAGCRLDMRLALDSERGVDGLVVETSTDGGATWHAEATFSGSSQGAFVPVDADLGSAEGSAGVLLRLRFTSDASAQGDGAYVDDLAVRCLGAAYGGRELVYADGTSFSAPVVSGIAALAFSLAPDLGAPDIKKAVLAGAVRLPQLAGLVATGARADALGTLRALPPGATTGAAAQVDATSGTLTGVVRPRGQATRFWFEIGPTSAYGTRLGEAAAGDAAAAQPVARRVGGLAPATTYHYRLVASGPAGTSSGADQTVTTPPGPAAPTVRAARLTISTGRATTARGRTVLPLRLSLKARVGARLWRGSHPVRRLAARTMPAGRRSLALGALPPGIYQLDLVAESAGAPIVTLTRTVRVVGARSSGRRAPGRRSSELTTPGSPTIPVGEGNPDLTLPASPVPPGPALSATPGTQCPDPQCAEIRPGDEAFLSASPPAKASNPPSFFVDKSFFDDEGRDVRVNVTELSTPGRPPTYVTIDWDGPGGDPPEVVCDAAACLGEYDVSHRYPKDAGIKTIVVTQSNASTGETGSAQDAVKIVAESPRSKAGDVVLGTADTLKLGKDLYDAVKDAPGKLVDQAIEQMQNLGHWLKGDAGKSANALGSVRGGPAPGTAGAAPPPRAESSASRPRVTAAANLREIARLAAGARRDAVSAGRLRRAGDLVGAHLAERSARRELGALAAALRADASLRRAAAGRIPATLRAAARRADRAELAAASALLRLSRG
jgi:subtilase family protein